MEYLLFAIGLMLIIKGGDIFVDAASKIAEASGIPKFIVGATIVSLATTLPEMIVSVIAASEGKVDMAIGNAIGSVTANTGMIMAISIIAMPVFVKRMDYLAKSLILMGAVALLWMFCQGGELRLSGAMVMFGIFLLFIYENIQSSKRRLKDMDREEMSKKEIAKQIVFFIIGAAAIVIGSDFLVDNGSIIAKTWGVPESVIALTLVAIGTSLPELVTTITSIIKKESEMSVGNILGANIIDTTLILPVCSAVSGGVLPVSQSTINLDIPVCFLVIAVVLISMLIQGRFHRSTGIINLLIYGFYIVYICII